jgi:ABC-type glycerol-3-phosphate transport system substrate-binding protein
MNSLLRCTAIVAGLLAGTPAVAQTEIQFWHAMAGEMGQRVEKLANDFNNSQKDFKVVAVYKGTYPEVMTGAIAAFRAKQAPHIVQVFEVGTATMMAAKGAIYPMHELMKDGGVPFDPSSYLPAVSGYFSDVKKFFSGECGMAVSSAAARLDIITNMKVDVGMALLPYYADVKGAPQNSIIGGASLWVLRGQKPEDYKGVAQFLTLPSHLLSLRNQTAIISRSSQERPIFRPTPCHLISYIQGWFWLHRLVGKSLT